VEGSSRAKTGSIRLSVLTELRLMTDRHRHGVMASTRANIASRAKMESQRLHLSVENETLFKVTDSNVHCESGSFSKMVQGSHVVTTHH